MSVHVVPLPADPAYAGLLGRRAAVLDSRSRAYPARALLGAAPPPLRSRVLRRPPAYDQGRTSQCVVYAADGLANTAPLRGAIPLAVRRRVDRAAYYRHAQGIDPWAGAEPDYHGTDVLSGVRTFVTHGVFGGYRWCFGLDDVLALLSAGWPVEVGTLWLSSMFAVDDRDVLVVDRRSRSVGGHAYELHGLDVRRETVVATNSWGLGWGARGRCHLRWDDLGWLLERAGEAVVAVAPGAAPPPGP